MAMTRIGPSDATGGVFSDNDGSGRTDFYASRADAELIACAPQDIADLLALAEAARRQGHRKSEFPASRGEHKGRHFCPACTQSWDDDFTAYVDWPCPIGAALARLDGEGE